MAFPDWLQTMLGTKPVTIVKKAEKRFALLVTTDDGTGAEGGGGGGDASAANQTTEITKLTSIDGKVPALGQALAAASVPVVLPATQITTLTPPAAITGFATSANQTTELTDLGGVTETAPGSDTASSGLNGRLQRIAQRLTTIIAGIPLLAGELHIGEVGGYKKSSTVEWTRPADTTAYAALDVIGTSIAISAATNATPIVVTSATHSLADGDPITISGVVGNTAANGSYFAKVTGFSSTTFALYSDKALATPVAGNGAYTSGGLIARLFRLTNAARIAAQNGYVVKGQLDTDQKTCVARVRIHIFNAPVPAILDNSPYTKLWTNRSERSGEINFPALYTEDPTNSTMASAIIDTNSPGSNLPLGFGTPSAQTDLYFSAETLDAFTPASGQNWYLRLMFEDD